MITFVDFSERLARGQLKNTSAVDEIILGKINPDYEATILDLTNQALVDISTRLPLITKQIDLTFVTDQNVYAFLDANNISSSYLSTALTGDIFLDEQFVKVLDIFDGNGNRHPVNTEGHILSPSYNTLRFTTSKITELTAIDPKVRIRYQAKHLGITSSGTIDIAPNLVTALQLFVSSLYISHMNGKEHSAKGDSYFAAYLRHIGEDQARDTSGTSEIEEDTRFSDRGFV